MKPLKTTASNARDLRVFNRVLVRDTIRKHGPIARHEVAKATGLTPPTVTVIVNELIRAGVVNETGRGESTGGRRPIMLELNPRAALVFTVQLQRGQAITALIDLAATVLGTHRLRLDTSDPATVVGALAESLGSLVADAGARRDDVLWCGVAFPGLVDSYRGVVERSSNLAWNDVPLATMLSESLSGIPVHVENNSNAAALGEKVYGSGKGCPNLIYLNLSVGVSAGIIIDNEVFGGARGYAGEVGHIIMTPDDGPGCTCGGRGCLEAMCGLPAIVRKVREVVPNEVLDRCGLRRDTLTADDVLLPPLIEAPAVRAVIREAGRLVGIAVSNLVSIFNTEMVILGGELPRAGDVFVDAVADVLTAHVPRQISGMVRVVRSTMEQDPPLMGAYDLALRKLLALPEWKGHQWGMSRP